MEHCKLNSSTERIPFITQQTMCITNSLHATQCSGYQPPEYIHGGEISGKFDIFSLGAVMIRIVSGPLGYPECSDMSSNEFIDQVRNDTS